MKKEGIIEHRNNKEYGKPRTIKKKLYKTKTEIRTSLNNKK